MDNILITGGAGFVGSNFIPFFLSQNSNYHVVNLDKLNYAGRLANLAEVESNHRYTFVQGDICDKQLLKKLFNEYQFKNIIHFAAESHVDNSILSPDNFIKTNIVGSFCLLDTAKKLWINKNNTVNQGFENARFIHVSTDEVYGSLKDSGLFTEKTAYAPRSPYSASKASSDLLAKSYFHTYGFPVIVTNCSNNYGPKQHFEKLIPTIIQNALLGKNIPIYGDGTNIRDWIYVLDHCKAIYLVLQNGIVGETYNIGGKNEWRNIDIAKMICKQLDVLRPPSRGKYSDLISFVKDRPGHDFRYAIDASKIENNLGWKPVVDFEFGIEKTISWYLNN